MGINVHDPKYGVWWETKAHGKKSYEYNQAWNEFFGENEERTFDEIMGKARELANKYGYNLNF